MVFVGEGIRHTSHHLLNGSQELRGEFLAKVLSQCNYQYFSKELCGRDKKNKDMVSRGTQFGVKSISVSSQAVPLEYK